MTQYRPTWLLTLWTRKQRRAAAAAAAAEESEQRAARQRVLEGAVGIAPVVRPVPLPAVRAARPLLTRGQAARTRRNER